MSAKKDFTIEKKSSWEISLIYKSKDKSPIDLSGYQARCYIYDRKNGVLLRTQNASVIGSQGLMKLSLSSDDTDSLNPGRYYYEYYIENGPSATIRLLQGTIEVIT